MSLYGTYCHSKQYRLLSWRVRRKNVASFPVPIPSFSILHIEKIREARDEAV